MKKFLVFLSVFVFSLTASASMKVESPAGTTVGTFHQMVCGTNLSCTASNGKLAIAPSFTSDLTGDGSDQLYGFLQNQIASTTTTLTAGQCGSTIVSDSADTVTLPEASTVLGCRYTFVCGTADDFGVNPNDATDQILGFNYAASTATAALAPSAGDAVQCTDAGSSLTIEAVGDDAWAAIGVANGTWSDID